MFINSREDQPSRKQLIARSRYISNWKIQLRRNKLDVQPLITLRLIAEQVINPPCSRTHSRKCRILRRSIITHSTHSRICPLHTSSSTARRPTSKEKMHSGRLEEMTMQLIDILQRPNTVRTNISLIPKRLQFPEDLRISVQLNLILSRGTGAFGFIGIHVIGCRRVNPLLDFDFAGSIVDLVCDVCGLRGNVADLADEADACCVGAIDLVVCFWVGLGRIECLFDCYRTESIVVYIALIAGLAGWYRSREGTVYLPFLLLDWYSSPRA